MSGSYWCARLLPGRRRGCGRCAPACSIHPVLCVWQVVLMALVKVNEYLSEDELRRQLLRMRGVTDAAAQHIVRGWQAIRQQGRCDRTCAWDRPKSCCAFLLLQAPPCPSTR
eukprot:7352448-Prymnesium_polylepis.1